MQNEMENFIKNIKFLRKSNNLSEKRMADILKISVKSLNKLEKGELLPDVSIEIVFNIYNYFGIIPKNQFSVLLEDKEQIVTSDKIEPNMLWY